MKLDKWLTIIDRPYYRVPSVLIPAGYAVVWEAHVQDKVGIANLRAVFNRLKEILPPNKSPKIYHTRAYTFITVCIYDGTGCLNEAGKIVKKAARQLKTIKSDGLQKESVYV